MSSKSSHPTNKTVSRAGISLLLPALVMLLSAIFSIYGVLETFRKIGLPPNLYETLGQAWNIVRDSPVVFVSGQEVSPHWTVSVGGLLAKVFPYAAFVTGAWVLFRERLKEVWWRLIPRSLSVYIGLGERGASLALAEVRGKKGQRVVAIDIDEHNSTSELLREHGGLFLSGSGTDPVMLRRAGIGNASKVVILTESDDVNVNVAEAVFEEWNRSKRGSKKPSRPTEIIVSIESHEYRQLLGDRWKILQKATSQNSTHQGQLSVRLTGFRSAAIRSVLLKIGTTQGKREEVRSKGLKVLVAGGNAFVEEFLKLAAAFLQLSGSNRDSRPEFVVCTNGNDLGGDFLRRYPLVDLIARVRFIGDEPSGVAWAPTLEGLRFDVAVVSLPTEAETLSMSERLVRTSRLNVGYVYAMVPSKSEVQLSLLKERMELVSITEEGCESLEFSDDKLEKGAREHHQAYVTGEATKGLTAPRWEELPEFLKESNRWVFLHGQIKKAIGDSVEKCTDEVKDKIKEHLAECEHQRWMGERIMDGWVYGPEKDPEKRTHPLLIAFDELSDSEKKKDVDQVNVSNDRADTK